MKLNLLKTLLLTCLLGVWGADVHAAEVYSFTPSSSAPSDWTSSTSAQTNTFTQEGITWTIVATLGNSNYYWSWSSSGIQMGSNNQYHSQNVISTSGLSEYTINKIVVKAHGNSGVSCKLSVKVGDTSFYYNGAEGTTYASMTATSSTEYSFEYPTGAQGDVVITYYDNTSHGLYLDGVEVYDADEHIDSNLAYSEDYLGVDTEEINDGTVVFPELTFVEGFNAQDEINYESSDTSIATVATDGTVSFTGTVGTTTITATFNGNDTYAASHSSYEIKVADPHTFDFETKRYGMTVQTNSNNYETEVFDITGKNNITMHFDGNHRLWYTDSGIQLRVNKGADFKIAAPTGSTLAEIVIHGTSSSSYISNLSADIDGFSVSGSVGTWTGDASSVTFTQSDADNSNALRVLYIDVTLSAPTSGSFTITEAGYATYYTDYEYTMPSGVMGTTVTGVTKDSEDDGVAYVLTLPWEYAEDSTVPAGTALVLKGEEGDYPYTITSTGATAPTDNLLMGSTTAVTTTGPDSSKEYLFYELSTDSDGNNVGFYWGATDGVAFTSEANKAWLPLDKSTIASARFIGFCDDTTGISSVENASEKAVSGIYTLQGVRVSDMNQKGVYIVDGRKVLVK